MAAGNTGDAYIVGAVGVSVEPLAKDFWAKFVEQTRPEAERVGGSLGSAIAGPLTKAIGQAITKGVRDGASGAQRAAISAGAEVGKALGSPLAKELADAIGKGLVDGARSASSKASAAGQAIGDAAAKPIKERTAKSLSDGVEEGGRKAAPKAKKGGEEAGGAFGEAFRRRIEAALKALPKAQVDANTTPAERKFAELRLQLEKLSNQRIGIDVTEAQALAQIDYLRAKLNELAHSSPSAEVRVDAAAAEVHLAAIKESIDKVDRDRATVKVDVDGGTRAVAELEAVDRASQSASSSGIGLSSSVVGWTTAIITLAPLAAAAVAGVGMAILSVGAAVGVGALAFVPLASAVQALQKQEADASQTAVTLASRQNAIASANDQVRNASQSLVQAEHEALRAEQALTQARIDAKRALEDLNSQVKNNALDQRQAAFDLQQAAQNLAIAKAGGAAGQISGPGVVAPIVNPLAVQEAQLAFDRAQQHADDLANQGKRIAEDQAKAQKAGIEGSAQVIAAQDRLANAQEAVTRAAQGIEASQRALKLAYAQASLTGQAGANSVGQAMKNLSPIGQEFAHFLFGLKPLLVDLSKAAQNGLFPGLEKGIKALLPLAPAITSFVTNVAKTMGDLFVDFAKDLRSPFWQDFFKFLAANASPILRDIAGVLRDVAKDVAKFLEAFAPAVSKIWPFISLFADLFTKLLIGLAPGAEAFLSGLTGLFQNLAPVIAPVAKAFSDVFIALSPILPLLGQVLADNLTVLSGVLSTIAQSIAPFAKLLADALTPVYKTLFPVVNQFVKTVLPPLAEAFGQMAKAFAPLIPVFGQFASVLAKSLLPILPQIGQVLSTQVVPVFAEFGKQVAGYLVKFLQAIVPHLPELVSLFGQLAVAGLQLLAAFLPLLPSIVQIATLFVDLSLKTGLAEKIVQLLVLAVKFLLFVVPLATAVINGAVGAIVWMTDTAKTLGHIIETVWNDKIHPVFKAIGDVLGATVIPAFQGAVDTIGGIWNGIVDAIRNPLRTAIDIINGFFDAYNTVASLFHLPIAHVHIAVPPSLLAKSVPQQSFGAAPKQTFGSKGFASGGYTGTGGKYEPAGIVHRGEYVIPKEIVAALGIRFFDELIGNRKSPRPGDGSEGIALPGYADGGLVGWVRSGWNAVADPIGTLRDKAIATFGQVGNAGLIRDMILGVGRAIVEGVTSVIGVQTTDKVAMQGRYIGPLSPTMQAVQAFIRAQAGKPYIWDAAGPLGYDCSGLMSAAWNILHGRNPYVHTFSTSNEAAYFPKPGIGPFTAGWAHAGERGGGSVGHTAGNLAGLAFESRGGVGVLVGPSAVPVTSFAHVGTYDAGGWLNPGDIAVNQGTRPEAVLTPAQSDALLRGARGGDGATAGVVHNYNLWGKPEVTLDQILAVQAQAEILQGVGLPH